MNQKIAETNRQIKIMLGVFMVLLVLSGATAMPVETELNWLLTFMPAPNPAGRLLNTLQAAVTDVNSRYPFLMYGNDWLAFAHLVIALAFIGPLRNAVRNIWVIEFGLIACVLVFPFALVMGGVRGLPLWWRFIDCSFGLFGFMLLWAIRVRIKRLEQLIETEKLNLLF